MSSVESDENLTLKPEAAVDALTRQELSFANSDACAAPISWSETYRPSGLGTFAPSLLLEVCIIAIDY